MSKIKNFISKEGFIAVCVAFGIIAFGVIFIFTDKKTQNSQQEIQETQEVQHVCLGIKEGSEQMIVVPCKD